MDSEEAIPLPNVTGPIMDKIVEYCTYHHENPQLKPKTEEETSTIR